jgi:hypothetical protein
MLFSVNKTWNKSKEILLHAFTDVGSRENQMSELCLKYYWLQKDVSVL